MPSTCCKSRNNTALKIGVAAGAVAVGLGGAYLAYRKFCQPKTSAAAAGGRTNVAIVFIKPHANNPLVRKMVRELLEQQGLKVLSQQNVTASEIQQRSLAAKHYYAIASKAGQWRAL